MKDLRINNFDLVRFLAAIQVLILHTKHHLKIQNTFLDVISNNFLQYFPGVPIFFVISGFLIYSSYERNQDNILQYIVNRSLRIFPALWVCFILTFLLINIDFDGNLLTKAPYQMLIWSFGQLSIFQFFTPNILRFWGVGSPNGSLWTIVVELQFYILIPLLFTLFAKFKKLWIPLGVVFLLSIVSNIYIGTYKFQSESIIGKIGGILILPYLYYFLIGVFFKKYWSSFIVFFKNKFWLWFVLYFIFILIVEYILQINSTSYWIKSPLNVLSTIFLACITLSFSFSFVGLGDKLLKKNDISYGLYIYHMIVVNFMVQRNLIGKEIYLLVVIIVTTLLATLSWVFIEKKALNSKKNITTMLILFFERKKSKKL